MKRAVVGRLRDIPRAIDEIAEVSEGITFKAYQADFRVRRIVERCVEIVSEASRHIPAEMKAKHPAVPWGAIWNIGNRLRHEYGYVDDRIMWRVATHSIRELRPAIVAMIAEAEK